MRIQELESGKLMSDNPKKAGVMALFYPDQSENTRLLFIRRKRYPGVHSGQIGFPGGKQEEGDRHLLDTALRETCEEVGAGKSQISVIRPMSDIYIPPSNFEVSPFVGLFHKTGPFVLQPSEVESIIEVPLSDVMDDEKKVTQVLSTSYAQNIEVPAFNFQGFTVWGATAMMLNEIKELLKQVL